jgi:IS6 family transposase
LVTPAVQADLRDVEKLLAERGVPVDHVTIYSSVQRRLPEFVEAARTCRRVPGDRWFVAGAAAHDRA